jgi:hypothetical protein
MPMKPESKKRTKRPKGAKIEDDLCTIRTETLNKTPWIDFLAAGVSGPSENRTGWVAFIHSAPLLVRNALSIQNRPSNETWRLAGSERAINVLTALTEIERHRLSDKPGITCEIPVNLSSIRAGYFQKAFADRMEGADKIITPASFIITWGDSMDAMPCQQKQSNGELETFNFVSFDAVLEFAFAPLRLHFGTGWLGNSLVFLEELIARRTQADGMVVARPAVSDCPPPEIAALATARLVSFGWLPSNWNCKAAMLGKAISDPTSKRTRALRLQFDQGLRVFEMPRVSFRNMISLNCADQEQLNDLKGLHFQSTNRRKRVVLAIEFTGYGKRKRTSGIFTGNRATQHDEVDCETLDVTHRYSLHHCTLNIVSVIMTLFPWIRTTVISCSETASATGRAGVLSRLIRHYTLNPHSDEFREQIKEEIRSLTYPSLPRHSVEVPGYTNPKYDTALDLCKYIDGLKSSSVNDQSTSEHCKEESGPARDPNPLQNIIPENEISFSESFPSDFKVADLIHGIMPLSAESTMSFSGSPVDIRPKRSRKELESLDREIRDNSDEIAKVDLTRASHFRPLTLFRSLLRLFHALKHHHLEVPVFLQRWVGSLIRLVWVMPLDPIGPTHTCMPNPRFQKNKVAGNGGHGVEAASSYYRSAYPGSPISPQIYPLLFNSSPCEQSCVVDLESLLRTAQQGIATVGAEANPGWLENRIVATNELMDDLRARIGYCPDFELIYRSESALVTSSLLQLLILLSSQTIIQCILNRDGGPEFLREWSLGLMQNAYQMLRDNEATHSGKDTSRGSKPDDSFGFLDQLGIFEDSSVIATAALDFCRDHLPTVIANETAGSGCQLAVYFVAPRLKKHFRSRVSLKSLDVREFDEARIGKKTIADTSFQSDDIVNVDVQLIKCFRVPWTKEVKDYAVGLLRRWYDEEGKHMGEDPDDMLESIADEMFDGCPTVDFNERRNAILKAFYES